MAKVKAAPTRSKNTAVTVSYASIAAVVGILTIIGFVFEGLRQLATKSDIESIRATITPTLNAHESRIRDLELANAAHFGASPATTRPMELEDIPVQRIGMVLAQYQMQQAPASASAAAVPLPPHRVVVPMEMITAYSLQPSRGGSYGLLGEDGRLYSLDDVLSVLIRMHLDEMRRLRAK